MKKTCNVCKKETFYPYKFRLVGKKVLSRSRTIYICPSCRAKMMEVKNG